MSVESETAANRSNWDERVAGHLVAYDVEGFVNDPTRLSGVVRDDLTAMAPYLPAGSPAGLDLVHLQCHIGLDTLSWARLGAKVTGVDFSPKSVNAVTDIAHRAGLQAQFVESEIRYAAQRLGEQYDIVYTSIGVLTWLSDLEQWARVVADLLRPGGLFYIRDSHPILNTSTMAGPTENS